MNPVTPRPACLYHALLLQNLALDKKGLNKPPARPTKAIAATCEISSGGGGKPMGFEVE